jgi:hypothetical protein
LKHHEDFTAKVEAEIGVKKEDVFTSFNDPNYPCSSMLRLTAPHTLRMGKKHYEIHRVSDCTIPCCRGVSDRDYLAGLLSDVTWLHFHKSGMMNPARWLLRARARHLPARLRHRLGVRLRRHGGRRRR